jgi:glycine dehydrogenase
MGSQGDDKQAMLDTVGYPSLDALMDATVPGHIRLSEELKLDAALTETEAISKLKGILGKNKVLKSFIGTGYYETITPPVILRNILENPGWYTSYTPYQAEISQGRLESLLNYQTMVADLTGMEFSNASLLDEATACAEAMSMCHSLANSKKKSFFVDENCHPQNIDLIHTRADLIGVKVVVGDAAGADFSDGTFCGALVQYPDTYGVVGEDWHSFNTNAHEHGVRTIASTDLMASVLCKPAGEVGFDIAVGVSQRFGVPMGFGGPHAAFLATTVEYSRKMPGRIIGMSIDSQGNPALRMAMQTREQHIRRDKATSNICTAQALLANMAAMYGVYHGPDGLKKIADRIHGMASVTADAVAKAGYKVENAGRFFDTLTIDCSAAGKTSAEVSAAAIAAGVNVRVIDDKRVGIAFGEAITQADTEALVSAFGVSPDALAASYDAANTSNVPASMQRTSAFLEHPIFNTHKSETQMLRYVFCYTIVLPSFLV